MLSSLDESRAQSAQAAPLPTVSSPPSSAATQLCEPFFQNGLLTGRDVRKHNAPFPCWGTGNTTFSARRKSGIRVRDSDGNLCAFWRRIQHVQEASPHAQVAGPWR